MAIKIFLKFAYNCFRFENKIFGLDEREQKQLKLKNYFYFLFLFFFSSSLCFLISGTVNLFQNNL